MLGRFIRPECDLWKECLAHTPHDFYHLPGYVRLCASQERAEPVAFVAQEGQNRLFVPLIVRPINGLLATSGGLYDASSPYGYPSPLLKATENGESVQGFLTRAVELLLSGCRRRGIVSVFLRLHPLLALPLEPFRWHGILVHHGETVFVDLTQTEEEFWHQTRRQYRNKINFARRNGHVAEMDPTWSSFDEFFEIYTQTMHRVRASEGYFFPREYFHKLRDVLSGALHLCVVRIDGRVACAGLFSEICGIVQAHLSGARPDYGEQHPTKLMMDFARRWAKRQGNRMFHLGGGVGARRDLLFQFKSGFSKLRSDFHTWRAVVDVGAYQALVRRWEQHTATEAEDLGGFFPAYRKSVIEPDELTLSAR